MLRQTRQMEPPRKSNSRRWNSTHGSRWWSLCSACSSWSSFSRSSAASTSSTRGSWGRQRHREASRGETIDTNRLHSTIGQVKSGIMIPGGKRMQWAIAQISDPIARRNILMGWRIGPAGATRRITRLFTRTRSANAAMTSAFRISLPVNSNAKEERACSKNPIIRVKKYLKIQSVKATRKYHLEEQGRSCRWSISMAVTTRT